jgi:putative oxidoreductase
MNQKKVKMSLSKIKNLIQKLFSPDAWSVDTGILLLRMSCALMLLHGWSKFTNFSEDSLEWPDPLHVGSTVSCALTVFAELFCTLFVVIGLFSRLALIPLIVLMIVIVFVIHSGDPLPDREHALMYLLSYLALLFTGPGKYSLERFFSKKR